jgi:hypothetical protein
MNFISKKKISRIIHTEFIFFSFTKYDVLMHVAANSVFLNISIFLERQIKKLIHTRKY